MPSPGIPVPGPCVRGGRGRATPRTPASAGNDDADARTIMSLQADNKPTSPWLASCRFSTSTIFKIVTAVFRTTKTECHHTIFHEHTQLRWPWVLLTAFILFSPILHPNF